MNITGKTTTIIDHQGNHVVLVPLSNGKGTAKLDEKDFLALQAAGHTGPWFLNSNGRGNFYVKTCAEGKLKRVSRLIVNPPPGLAIQYRDNDRTNLRRGNLFLKSRKELAKGKAYA
jgi:hypothetical protein